MTKALASLTIAGALPDGSTLYAAVDPNARYCKPLPCKIKLAALLAPFASVGAARDALEAAGAALDRETGQ